MANDVNIKIGATDATGGIFSRISRSLGGLGKAALAFVGGRAILGGLKATIGAYSESEQALSDLRQSLEAAGDPADALLPKFEKFAKTLQQVTTYEDDFIISQMALARNMGVSADKLEETTTAALGLSKIMGVDLDAAMKIVMKASKGNTAGLEKYGLVMKNGMNDQEKYAALLKLSAKGFSQLYNDTKTTTGQLKQLNNEWGNLKEDVGGALVQGFNLPKVLDELNLQLQAFNETGGFKELASDVGMIGSALGELKPIADNVFDSIAAGLNVSILSLGRMLGTLAGGGTMKDWAQNENKNETFVKTVEARQAQRSRRIARVGELRAEREAKAAGLMAPKAAEAVPAAPKYPIEWNPNDPNYVAGPKSYKTLDDVVEAIESLKAQ